MGHQWAERVILHANKHLDHTTAPEWHAENTGEFANNCHRGRFHAIYRLTPDPILNCTSAELNMASLESAHILPTPHTAHTESPRENRGEVMGRTGSPECFVAWWEGVRHTWDNCRMLSKGHNVCNLQLCSSSVVNYQSPQARALTSPNADHQNKALLA